MQCLDGTRYQFLQCIVHECQVNGAELSTLREGYK